MNDSFSQDDAVIRVEGVSKRYGKLLAVDGIGFSVRRGTTTALLGANGAGKTTTLSILVGLLLPDAGRVTILGEDVLRHRYRVLPRMNYSSPYVDIPHRLTVMDNLRVFAGLYGVRSARARIASLAADLNLGDLLKRPYGQLSSGQRTRVALAKALLNQPQVLLMDEPTASLDPDMADYVRNYLRSYQARTGATLLMASHNMTEVERICEDVVMLREGRQVAQGPPQALLERYGRRTLEEVFIDIARGRSSTGSEPAAGKQDDPLREAAP